VIEVDPSIIRSEKPHEVDESKGGDSEVGEEEEEE
jgi:hypothetical protein